MILQISADAKELILFSDEPFHTTKKKKLAKTSKTGLKLHQKLLLIRSPERTDYRKSYLARRLKVHNALSCICILLNPSGLIEHTHSQVPV